MARLEAEAATFSERPRTGRGALATAIEAFDDAGLGYEAARSRVRSGLPDQRPGAARTLAESGASPGGGAAGTTSLTPRE